MQELEQHDTEKHQLDDKRHYEPPIFVEYGSITALTRASNMGSCPDSAVGMVNLMQCNTM
ncbi:MAG TPA: lasso RiPP family leader peptide-containing protein [Blastocatellia bacterium]|nr:lasso RiPP family leader peptide-containing protein [Blastocatellia bacterium]